MKKNRSGGTGTGCLGVIGIILLVSIALAIYSYFWIPAIFVLIYCLLSKKFRQYRVRNSAICIAVIVTSFLVFGWLNAPAELDGISVDWGKTEFYAGEEAEIQVNPEPSDAEIEKLTLSKNEIASLKYEDGKAIVTFKNEGSAALFFTANDDINSSTQKITVIDKEKQEAEEQKKAEELKKQEEIKQQKQQEQQELEEQQRAQEKQQTNEDPVVYITNTGSKYHTSSCRTLKKSKIERHLSEVKGSYEPCGICNPPQ